jgi:hypothetical protein
MRFVVDGAAFSGAALTHGFHIAFCVLAALGANGGLISALMLESRPAHPERSYERRIRTRGKRDRSDDQATAWQPHVLPHQFVHARALFAARGATPKHTDTDTAAVAFASTRPLREFDAQPRRCNLGRR